MKKNLSYVIILVLSCIQLNAQLTGFAIPGRPDNLTQGQVDQLLANGQMNFDGLRFDNKRMEFINFEKGSFRGTTFYNCILDDGVARRKSAEPDRFDLEDANIYLSKLKRVSFSNWKFLRTVFQGDSITDAEFKYCAFTDNKIYNSTIIKVLFNNGSRIPYNNIQVNTSKMEGCRFDSIKFNGGAFGSGVNFVSSIFNTVEFFNVNFMKIASLNPIKFTGGCNLKNVKFTSAVLESVVFGEAPTGMWLENVSFENTIWRNGAANASFNENCVFKGQSTLLQNINFGTSVFNSATFGQLNTVFKVPVKLCRFNSCTFNGPVIFYNCNLENTTFPAVSVLQAAGVKFINCLYAPYNSPG